MYVIILIILDASTQLQISPNAGNDVIGSLTSPTLNSTRQIGFIAPASKNRVIGVISGSGTGTVVSAGVGSGGSSSISSSSSNIVTQSNTQNITTFQHPAMSRSVSLQMPIRQSIPIQPRITQSPFSPQSHTPQSPHDQFPLSPATSAGIESYTRSPSENSQQEVYINVRDEFINSIFLKNNKCNCSIFFV